MEQRIAQKKNGMHPCVMLALLWAADTVLTPHIHKIPQSIRCCLMCQGYPSMWCYKLHRAFACRFTLPWAARTLAEPADKVAVGRGQRDEPGEGRLKERSGSRAEQ